LRKEKGRKRRKEGGGRTELLIAKLLFVATYSVQRVWKEAWGERRKEGKKKGERKI